MTTTYADSTTNTEHSDGIIITYPMVQPLRQGGICLLFGTMNICHAAANADSPD